MFFLENQQPLEKKGAINRTSSAYWVDCRSEKGYGSLMNASDPRPMGTEVQGRRMRTALTKVPYGSLNSVASTCDAPWTMSRRPRTSRRKVWEAVVYTIDLNAGTANGMTMSCRNVH
ncbi:hypothetical protein EVAR_84942_1 [Eumeta japonica]|uniref:Uncharacterized protein n=1 Tax=Eumeta variegata TaxID=151549 RepID=A0A4C1VJS4_EUMVA|nr:hypothetical protein EVAR_84942_1 [Eumeta japonica]